MSANQFNNQDNIGRDRSATFGMGAEGNFAGPNNERGGTSTNFETFLSKYEFLRLNYENEGISQQSLLLLRRLSKGFHDQDPGLSNLPILKEMVNVCKKLMLNDFEILIWAIYLKETVMNRNDFIDYLSTSAMFVKKDLNEPDVFRIFETFFAHNHSDTFAKYASSGKPQVTLTLKRINYYNMTLLAPFEANREKEIQDFNYEVDALEDEHVRREVHTTKVIVDDDNENPEAPVGDKDYTEVVNKNNKRARKARARNQVQAQPKPTPPAPVPTKQKLDEVPIPTNAIKAKREAKKSFDFYPGDDRSDNHSESPFSASIQPKFMPTVLRSPTIAKQNDVKEQPILFSQIGANMTKKTEEKVQDTSSSPFGAPLSNIPPTIPAGFNRPKPSIESIGHGMSGAFDHIDEPMGFISREFMDKSNENQNDQKGLSNFFKPFNNPFASGEFGRSFEPGDMNRNLLHPTPKYQK